MFEELFHLTDDPTEQKNLADELEYAEVLKAYRNRCMELVVELADQ